MKKKELSRSLNAMVKVEIMDRLSQDEINRREKTLGQLIIIAAERRLKKRKENLWIRVGKPLYSAMRMLCNECVEKNVPMDVFLNELLIMALNRKDEVDEIFNRLPKVEFKEGTVWPTESQVKSEYASHLKN